MADQSKHDLTLDAVRGTAAQAVVVGHTSSVVFETSILNDVLGWCSYSAVLVFFVLSGYVIVGSIIRETSSTGKLNYLDFAIRRVARIMPPFLFTIAFVFWFFTFTDSGNRLAGVYDLSWISATRSMVFAFTSHDAIVLTPVWSLRLEVGLYIFAALGATIYLTRGATRYLFAAGFTFFIAVYFWKLSFAGTSVLTFGLGAILAFWFFGKARSKASPSTFVRYVARTGDYSYTLYLAHMPVILIVASAIPDRTTAFALSVLAANLFAFAAALVVERPSLYASMIRSIGRQRLAQAG